MEKFGVKVEIKQEEPKKIEEPVLPITSSVEQIVSIQPEVSQSAETPKTETTGSAEIK
jgi:hypothetical protein